MTKKNINKGNKADLTQKKSFKSSINELFIYYQLETKFQKM